MEMEEDVVEEGVEEGIEEGGRVVGQDGGRFTGNLRETVTDMVCVLEGFKTGIKDCHWASPNMSEHRLCDEISGAVDSFQDFIAENEQARSGFFGLGVLIPVVCELGEDGLYGLLLNLECECLDFLEAVAGSEESDIALVSETENFLGVVRRFQYQDMICRRECGASGTT